MDIYEELGLIQVEPIDKRIEVLDDEDVEGCKTLKYYMKIVK